MNDLTLPLSGLSSVGGKSVVARFDGGMLSSDSGVLALAEVEKRLRVADRLARCIDDRRNPDQVIHNFADMIGFHMKMIAAGYADGNDANRLRSDPVFKMAQDAPPFGSGSGVAIDDVSAGEPTRCALAARHGPGDGRPLLRLLPADSEADRARHRRHVGSIVIMPPGS